MDPSSRRIERLAREDLAARLKLGDDQIETHLVQPRAWPDSSLGCPRPGLSYAQMVTPGYLIELRVMGRIWSYHSDLRQVIACDATVRGGRLGPGRAVDPPPPASEPVDR